MTSNFDSKRILLLLVILTLFKPGLSQGNQTQNNLMQPQVFGFGKIPVVGINEKGEPEEIKITQDEYKQKMSAATLTIYDSLMPVLNKQEANKTSKWEIRVVDVGVGVTAEIGIGPVKVGVIPKMRMLFTNHRNPVAL